MGDTKRLGTFERRTFATAEEILDFAIDKEDKAYAFYRDFSTRASSATVRGLFKNFAREEERHKVKLMEARQFKLAILPSGTDLAKLAVEEFVTTIDTGPNLTALDALQLAMNQEKAAFRLYSELARRTEEERLKSLFLTLAEEEAKHKLHLETEYDRHLAE